MQNQPGLDGEPKVMSPNKLAGFSIEASSARASILSMNGILWKEDGAYSREGDELTVLRPDASVQQEHGSASTEMTEGTNGVMNSFQRLTAPKMVHLLVMRLHPSQHTTCLSAQATSITMPQETSLTGFSQS